MAKIVSKQKKIKQPKKKYSVIQYNFNNYEILHEVEDPSPNCEYIYITDNKDIKSNTWKIVLEDKKLKSFNEIWQKCFYIKYHLFEYCKTPVCIYMDGSISIKKNLDKLIDDFEKSNCDFGAMIHPSGRNVADEVVAFVKARGYEPKLAINQGALCDLLNYDLKQSMFQSCIKIQKNTKEIQILNELTYQFMKYTTIGSDLNMDRLDQTIYSIIYNKFFKQKLQLFLFTEHLIHSSYLDWNLHGKSDGMKDFQPKAPFYDPEWNKKFKETNPSLYYIE